MNNSLNITLKYSGDDDEVSPNDISQFELESESLEDTKNEIRLYHTMKEIKPIEGIVRTNLVFERPEICPVEECKSTNLGAKYRDFISIIGHLVLKHYHYDILPHYFLTLQDSL